MQLGEGISSQLSKCWRSSWPPKRGSQARNLKGLDTPGVPALPVPLRLSATSHWSFKPGLLRHREHSDGYAELVCHLFTPVCQIKQSSLQLQAPHGPCPAQPTEPMGTASWDTGESGLQREAEGSQGCHGFLEITTQPRGKREGWARLHQDPESQPTKGAAGPEIRATASARGQHLLI